MQFYWLIIGILCAWRVTHLLHAEDGPANVFARLRGAAGTGAWGDMLDCFNCLSLVVAAPLAVIIGDQWMERALVWPALSAGAILLERLTTTRETATPLAHYIEDTEETNELLRQDATTDDGRQCARGPR
jgi:hypothetical protein